jgi:hypothetical protein
MLTLSDEIYETIEVLDAFLDLQHDRIKCLETDPDPGADPSADLAYRRRLVESLSGLRNAMVTKIPTGCTYKN